MIATERQNEFRSRITELKPDGNPAIDWGKIPAELYSPGHAFPLMVERQRQIDQTKAVIIPIAKEFFSDTGLVKNDTDITQEDIEKIFQFFERVKPSVDAKLQSNYWNHITGAYARAAALTEYIYPDDQKTQNLLKTRLLFHDIGRLFDAEDYRLNDILADEFFTEVGIKEEITKGLLPLDRVLGLATPSVSDINTYDPTDPLNNEQIMVLDIADNFGRINERGEFLSDTTIMGYIEASPKRNPKKLFAEQRTGVEAFYRNNDAVHSQYVQIIQNGLATLKQKLSSHGITWEQYNKRSQEIFNEAKEKQIKPIVERTLQEAPIHTVIFDLGDVVFGADDKDLYKKVHDILTKNVIWPFRKKEFSIEDISSACIEQYDLGMTADTDTKKLEFLNTFYKKFSYLHFDSPDAIEIASYPFHHPDIYKKRPEMIKLIKYLLEETNVQIIILSDMIAPVQNAVERFLHETIPELYDEKYKQRVRRNFSPDLGIAKRSPGTGAFVKILSHIPEDQRKNCVFIDDKLSYVEKAQVFGIRAIQFHNDFQHMDTLLQSEMRKAV